MEMLKEYYLLIKSLHIISFIAWMAGMLYLPRLFVYHADAKSGSELSETLKVMERRLMRVIINPAMVATFVFGLLLASTTDAWSSGWFHLKFTLAILLGGVHGMFSRWRKDFEKDQNTRPAKFFRTMNEVPTVIMIAMVLLAVIKPF